MQDKDRILHTILDAAVQSGLFDIRNIKVRLRPYADCVSGAESQTFLHVFGYIMGGRTMEQRNALSKSIVRQLSRLLPDVPVIAMNVMEFEKATYNNLESVR